MPPQSSEEGRQAGPQHSGETKGQDSLEVTGRLRVPSRARHKSPPAWGQNNAVSRHLPSSGKDGPRSTDWGPFPGILVPRRHPLEDPLSPALGPSAGSPQALPPPALLGFLGLMDGSRVATSVLSRKHKQVNARREGPCSHLAPDRIPRELDPRHGGRQRRENSQVSGAQEQKRAFLFVNE